MLRRWKIVKFITCGPYVGWQKVEYFQEYYLEEIFFSNTKVIGQ